MSAASAKPRIVIDTNVIVSAVINARGAPGRVLAALEAGRIVLLLAEQQREELGLVLLRPKVIHHYHVSLERVAAVLETIDRTATVVPPQPSPLPVRDPKDGAILAAAVYGRADYLVTGDADLLVLAEEPALGRLRIVTPADFLVALDAE